MSAIALPRLEALARFLFAHMMLTAKARGLVSASYPGTWETENEACRDDWRDVARAVIQDGGLLIADACLEQIELRQARLARLTEPKGK